MAKKKTSKRVSHTPRASKGFFEKHRHMKWLLPLLLFSFLLFLFVHHTIDEAEDAMQPNSMKENVKSMIQNKIQSHMNGNDESSEATMTPTTTPATVSY